jgi:hypothetical protein
MATYSNNGGTTGFPASSNVVRVIADVVDFTVRTVVASDVVRVLNIPANTAIIDAGIEVLTVDSAGASGTVALGDGTTTWVSAAAPTSTGQMTSASVAIIIKNAADTLDVTIGTGAVNAKLRVWAIVADLNVPKTTAVQTYS